MPSRDPDDPAKFRSLGHLPALDGLRGVALLLVLAFHARELSFGVLPGGFLGVDLFFVLSGFLITALLLGERRPGVSRIAAFYRRRALRLLPALVVVLAASTAYAWAIDADPHRQWRAVLYTLAGVQNWANIFALGPHPQGTLGYWSLSLQEQFYLVWPWLVLTVLARERRAGVVVAVLAGAFVAVGIDRYFVFRDLGWLHAWMRTDTHADGLVAGSLVAHLWIRGLAPVRGVQTLAWATVAMVAVLLPFTKCSDAWVYSGGLSVVTIGASIVLVALLDGRWTAAPVFSSRPLVAIGRVSYGAYLWHGLVFQVVLEAFPGAGVLLRLILGIGLTAVATALSWRLVERPFLAWKERLESRDAQTAALAEAGAGSKA